MTTIKLENKLYKKLIKKFIEENPDHNKNIEVIFDGEIFELVDIINFNFPYSLLDYEYSCDLIIKYKDRLYKLEHIKYIDTSRRPEKTLKEVKLILVTTNTYADIKSNTHEDIIPTNTPKKYIRIIDYVIENYSNCCWSIESFDDEHCLSLKGDAKLFLDSRWDINKQMNAVDFVVDLYKGIF